MWWASASKHQYQASQAQLKLQAAVSSLRGQAARLWHSYGEAPQDLGQGDLLHKFNARLELLKPWQIALATAILLILLQQLLRGLQRAQEFFAEKGDTPPYQTTNISIAGSEVPRSQLYLNDRSTGSLHWLHYKALSMQILQRCFTPQDVLLVCYVQGLTALFHKKF